MHKSNAFAGPAPRVSLRERQVAQRGRNSDTARRFEILRCTIAADRVEGQKASDS